MIIYSNIAGCYVNLELFEDAIEFCNKILAIEKDHVKANYRKAKALAGLYEFKESIEFFKKLKKKDEIKITEL